MATHQLPRWLLSQVTPRQAHPGLQTLAHLPHEAVLFLGVARGAFADEARYGLILRR